MTDNLFANPIYEHFEDHGSPSMGFHFRAATLELIADFVPVGTWKRKDGFWRGEFGLGITYMDDLGVRSADGEMTHDSLWLDSMKNVMDDLGAKEYNEATSDILWFEPRKSIESARNMPLYWPQKPEIQSGRHPTGRPEKIFLRKSEPTKEEARLFPEVPLTGDQKKALYDRAMRVLGDFLQTYSGPLEERVANIDKTYPINPSVFFSSIGLPRDKTAPENHPVLGTVFFDHFSIEPTRICCDTSVRGGAGFDVSALTDQYELSFRYNKNAPDKSSHAHSAGTLQISKGMIGLAVEVNDAMEITIIQETGAPNNHWADHYEIKEGRPASPRPTLQETQLVSCTQFIWNEFKKQFRLEERARYADKIDKDRIERIEKTLGFIGTVPSLIL